MTNIGVALIGAGMIAKTHVSALSQLQSRCQLKAIISTRPERAEYLCEYYQGKRPTFSSDLSTVVDQPDIHMVIVATPANVRIDLITALAQAGKHVLLEKPIARDLKEATHVVELCENAGIKLGMLLQHRVQDAAIAAKEKIVRADLGAIGLVEINAPLWRPQSYYDELERGTYARDGGGVLITQAIHTLDLALSLAGPVTRVQAMIGTTDLHQMEAEDYAVAGLHFASGAIGSLTASTATYPQGKETIKLHGQLGSLHLTREVADIYWRDGRVERCELSTDMRKPGDDKSEWHKRVIEDFLECVENDVDPIATGKAALDVHRLIDAVERSSRAGHIVTV